MAKLIQASEVAKRLAAGETIESIFVDQAGAYAAKLAGPEATVAVVSDADRSIDFAISTEAIDRYTDVVSLGGWQTRNYVRNPVVLWAHDDSIPAIARGTNVRIENKGLRSTAVFAEREFHPLADTIYQLLKGKFINAASVGFIPLKAKAAAGKDRPFGLDILEQELLEWSVVNIPANPECLVQARSVGVDTAPLIGWAERVLDKGGMLLIPRAELEALRRAAGAPELHQVRATEDWQCGAARDLPLADTDTWDGAAAAKRMLDAAGFDGDQPDVAKAKRGFLAHDASKPTERGSYKLPFADLVDGELKAMPEGIRNAASRLPQTDVPQGVKDSVRAVIDHYEGKMDDGKKAAPVRKIKSLWHVAWLADILMDLDCLEDCVAFEAELEGDGSGLPQRIADALKNLGQILIDLTAEEVAEMLGEEGEPVVIVEPMEMSGRAGLRMRALRRLARAEPHVLQALIEAFPQKSARLVDMIALQEKFLAALAKAGKVLSAANEKSLRDAHDHMSQACDMVKAVLDYASSADEDDDNDEKAAVARRRRAAAALKLRHDTGAALN